MNSTSTAHVVVVSVARRWQCRLRECLGRTVPGPLHVVEHVAGLTDTLLQALPTIVVVGDRDGAVGVEAALVAVRHLAPGVPVVVFAARATERDVVEAFRRGATDYIETSASAEVIEDRLRQALSRRTPAGMSAPRLEGMLDRLDIALFRTGPDGHLLWATPAMGTILGRDVAPPERGGGVLRLWGEAGPSTQAPLSPGTVGLIPLIRADGTPLVAEGAMFEVRDISGRLLGYEGYLRDVTEAESAKVEEAYTSLLLNQVPHAVVGSDTQARITYWNRGAEHMFGQPSSAVLGRDAAFSIENDPTGEQFQAALDALRTVGTWEGEVVARGRGGLTIDVLCRASQLVVDGAVVGYMGVLVDVTPRKRVEAQLRETLAERERLLTEAHRRARSNLQLVSSLLSIQLSRLGDPSLRRLSQETQNRIRALALLHERLLQSPGRSTVDMPQYLGQITRYLAMSFDTRTTIDLRIGALSLGIEQATRVGLIVNELVSNALRHAFQAAERGTILVRLAPTTGGGFELEVADSGRGLPAGFEVGSGPSLGLRLVADLAGRMGASMTVHGESGASFRFQFPSPDETP